MLEILCSYRETKRQSTKRKRVLENKREGLEIEKDAEKKLMMSDGDEGSARELERIEQEIFKVNHDIGIMNAAISDLSYAIEWITKGGMPGAMRGIERQSVYKREISFDDKWIDLLIDEGVQLHEIPEPDKEERQLKVDIVKDLKGYLTPKQAEVFTMLGEGLEQTEIAEVLGVSKQAVNDMVTRGRRKIKDAGWILV